MVTRGEEGAQMGELVTMCRVIVKRQTLRCLLIQTPMLFLRDAPIGSHFANKTSGQSVELPVWQ